MAKTENKKRAPAWLGIVSFLVYSSFFIFLMYKYGYSHTDTRWIRKLNYTIIQTSATILFVCYWVNEYLTKQNKQSSWFGDVYDLVSTCIIGMSIAFPLFIIMLFKF